MNAQQSRPAPKRLVARDDNVGAPRKRLFGQALPGFAAHDAGLAQREALEMFHVVGNAPGNFTPIADHPIVRDRDDEGDEAHFSARLSSACPLSR